MTIELHALRVLIAEDHFPARQMVTGVLRARNITHIDGAVDGKQARDMIDEAQLAAKPYHIVFLDWDMPQIEGIDVLKHFRAQPQFARTAFVMITSASLQAQVLEAVKAGATAYMIKPVSVTALDKKVTEVLALLKQKQVIV